MRGEPEFHPRRLFNEEYIEAASAFRVLLTTLPTNTGLHWHEFYELAFVLAGTGTHMLNGVAHQLCPGSMFFLTPADFHEFIVEIPLEKFNIVFSEEMLCPELQQLLFTGATEYQAQFEGQAFAGMEAEFRRIWCEVQHQEVGYQLAAQAGVERILIDLARQCRNNHAEPPGNSGQHPAIHRALTHMHHHFREPLRLGEVAGQAQLVPNYFSEMFHKSMGMTFQAYLTDLRLRFAMSLLKASTLSVTEVCHISGFNTLSNFSRAFKRKFGRPPRSFQPKGQR